MEEKKEEKNNEIPKKNVFALKKFRDSYRSISDLKIKVGQTERPFVEFLLKPTKHTENLLKIFLNASNRNGHYVMINLMFLKNLLSKGAKEKDSDIDLFREINIIKGMFFSFFTICETEEFITEYPVIIETTKLGENIKIQFNDKFIDFFDKYFYIDNLSIIDQEDIKKKI